MKRKNILYAFVACLFCASLFVGSQIVTKLKYTPAPLAELMPVSTSYNDFEGFLDEHPQVELLFIYQEGEQNSEYVEKSVLPNLFALYPNTDFSSMVIVNVGSNLSTIELEAIKQKFSISSIPSIVHLNQAGVDVTASNPIVVDAVFDWSNEEHLDIQYLETFLSSYNVLQP